MERIRFKRNMVGLIVRGKLDDGHVPGIMQQHADCILPNGEPVGFFGNNGAATGGASSVSWNSVHMNKQGVVIDYRRMKRIMPYFVDVAVAKKRGVKSTVLLVEVDQVEALIFSNFWKSLADNPSVFHLLGNNCSTHASKAFIKAGILNKCIPGLDTPDHLYRQLKNDRTRKTVSYSGYLGHVPGEVPGIIDLVVDSVNQRR